MRQWFGGGSPGSLADDLRALGASDETLAEWEGAREPFALWPDAGPAFELFTASATQWTVAGMGGVLGLDYTAVRVVAEWIGVVVNRAIFDDLRVMEAEAVRLFREGQEK